MKVTEIIFLSIITLGINGLHAQAVTVAEQDIPLRPVRTTVPPTVDGVIDDAAWAGKRIVDGGFVMFQPRYGEPFPLKTEIFTTYDGENIYFAFRCHDDEPDRIKTSITKRDNIFSDDFVAVSLDALGTMQTAYIFCVNPSGIQGDLLETGGNNDPSSDWVWESAGRITGEGYQVELRIPLKSIQYTADPDKPMRVGFVRNVNRSNSMGSWPELKPSDNLLTMQAPIVFEELETVRKLEVLPSFTYGSMSARSSRHSWSTDNIREIGGDFKYSLSSSVTLDATVNPDFSQVEADAFQVDVNRRYPIYNSEKRPYFMEVNGLFRLGGTGGGNTMRTAVHTRRIVDPSWSTKITGTSGKTLFSVLAAEDAWNGDDASTANPRFLIARGKHSLSNGDYIGAIYTGRNASTDYNHVAGIDGAFRFRDDHTVDFSVLQSASHRPSSEAVAGGNAAGLNYNYSIKPLSVGFRAENLTDEFRMDTSFLRRTGISRACVYVSPKYYPDHPRLAWIKRLSANACLDYIREHHSGAEDVTGDFGLRFSLDRSGWLNVKGTRKRESWKGKTFLMTQGSVGAGVQAASWLEMSGWVGAGKSIFYGDDPFLGDIVNYGGNVTLRPGANFNQYLGVNHAGMTNPADGGTAYDLYIFNTRSTYQFNEHFFVRGIYQFNTKNSRQLIDLLASFTLIPGTVVQLGYGTLLEEGRWLDGEWETDGGDLRALRKSLFFKTSYRHVF